MARSLCESLEGQVTGYCTVAELVNSEKLLLLKVGVVGQRPTVY